MKSEEITFLNQTIKIAGTLYFPEGKAPYPAVVVVHPASGGERTDPFYDHLRSALPAHGIAVLIFDRRGSGASEGDFATADFEDLAWGKWAKEQGYDIAYVAEAEIIHIHNETPTGVFNRYRREAMAFKRIYPEAHFSVYDFIRLTAMNILSDLWHAIRERVLWKNIASIFWFRFMQFHGTRLGHRETGLITPQLRETFYYARERKPKNEVTREVEPIRYNH